MFNFNNIWDACEIWDIKYVKECINRGRNMNVVYTHAYRTDWNTHVELAYHYWY